jgi:thiosulfate dehydrogenase (quinone) large subunit
MTAATAATAPALPAPPSSDRFTAPRWTVVPLRLYLGAAFLNAASNKVGSANWNHWPDWMAGVINGRLPHAAALYRPILSDLIVPHVHVFAPLVAITEIVVGIALLLGGATRLAAAIGILLTANYFLLDGMTVIDVSNDAAFIVALMIVLIARAGRTFGVDSVVARRWPYSRLW